MEIRKSTQNDIDAMLKIYAQARKFMRENGNLDQWKNNYPPVSILEEDIEKGRSYICIDEDEVLGTFMYTEEKDPTYKIIEKGQWVNEEPYGVVHRIASLKGSRGVATFCLDWCFGKCGNLRIDTHEDNIPMQNLLKKVGFVQCGIIYLENGDERIAFQKTGMQD